MATNESRLDQRIEESLFWQQKNRCQKFFIDQSIYFQHNERMKKFCLKCLIVIITTSSLSAWGATIPTESAQVLKKQFSIQAQKSNIKNSGTLIFDLPVTYNAKVSKWIRYYQTSGRRWFREWLERANKYVPMIQSEFKKNNLPTDLAYMSMIESGFSSHARSHADAVGPWQFIEPTALRYGLTINWWLDERKDLAKSTKAAIRYMKDLYAEFGSWYLVAASYNMGETGLRKRINKHKTKDYWALIRLGALPEETQEYVPKILAAMLIAKAPNLYGFRDIEVYESLNYELVVAPGGTDIDKLADHLGVTRKSLRDLNAELLLRYIPRRVKEHVIRVPKGAAKMVAEYVIDSDLKYIVQ